MSGPTTNRSVRRRSASGGLFRRYLAYTSLFTLGSFLLLTGLSYVMIRPIVFKNSERFNRVLLANAISTIDRDLQELGRTVMSLSYDVTLGPLLDAERPFAPADYFSLAELNRQIGQVKLRHDVVDECLLYLQQSRTVLDGDGVYDLDAFVSPSGARTAEPEWRACLSFDLFWPETRTIARIRNLSGSGESRYIVHQTTYPLNLRPKATAMLILDGQKLLDIVNVDTISEQAHCIAVDQSGEVVLSSGASRAKASYLIELAAARRTRPEPGSTAAASTVSFEGTRYAVIAGSSPANRWTYFVFIPVADLIRDVRSVRIAYAIVLASSLLVAATLSLVFSRRAYRPIRRLLEVSSVAAAGSDGGMLDEVSRIRRNIESIFERSRHLERRLEEHRELIREHLYERLVRGETAADDEIAEIAPLGVRGSWMCVLAVRAEACGKASGNGAPRNGLPDQAREKVLQLARSRYTADVMQPSAGTFLCLLSSTRPFQRSGLHGLAQEFERVLSSSFTGPMTIGIGRPHKDAAGLSASHREALEALDRRIMNSSCQIIGHGEAEARESARLLFPIREEIGIINALLEGDGDGAATAVRGIIASNNCREASRSFVHRLAEMILDTLHKAASECAEESLVSRATALRTGLAEYTTVDEVEESLCGLCHEIASQVSCRRLHASGGLVRSMIEFVEGNYANSLISLEMIADSLGVGSPSHLSRLFRDETKESFVSYLTRVRLTAAKDLLETTELKVSDVAKACGFNGCSYFIKLFRGRYGVSPSRYKECAAASGASSAG